jgi:hypothetical protein
MTVKELMRDLAEGLERETINPDDEIGVEYEKEVFIEHRNKYETVTELKRINQVEKYRSINPHVRLIAK